MHTLDSTLRLTEDERWRELLAQFGVPSQPGVYVLGCFARHVTFYSQQVRALNLVDALCCTGTLRKGARVGIVGAGLSGLTAAAGALVRGVDVHVFEKAGDPKASTGRMLLQDGCDERWIDPFVYDWPLSETGAGDDEPLAGLPLLDWQAKTADEVRETVLQRFEELVARERKLRGNACIHFHEANVQEHKLKRDAGGISVEMENGESVAVDVLILAVGFGVEDPRHTSKRYWSNDGLRSDEHNGRQFLVSGLGDGGLTDLMRLCIAEFRHRRVLAAFRNSATIGMRLKAAAEGNGVGLTALFLNEAAALVTLPEVQAKLPTRNTKVYLMGSPESLLGPQASGSILNRLIVACLFVAGRFTMIDARIRTPVAVESGRYTPDYFDKDGNSLTIPQTWVWGGAQPALGGAAPASFDDIVVRHGPGQIGAASGRPHSPMQLGFPSIWADTRELREFWRKRPHWEDWSRVPNFGAEDFTPGKMPPLDPPAGPGKLIAVVEQAQTKGLVQRAVKTAKQRIDKSTQHPAPLVALDPVLDSSTSQRFGRAVRTLCRADVAVFDLTDVEHCAETLVLLGIRAVSRRGVTLITARFSTYPVEPHEADAGFEVPGMPFLLQDATVFGWSNEESFINRIKRGIEEGLARAESLGPIYRDLPAYDEVRRLGPEVEDYRPVGPATAVLFLSSFDAEYRRLRGSWLRSRVGTAADGKPIYIIESASPERTSSKLYGAIRRTQFCMVDWTGRRPNVFFELGVRLATTSQPPVSVIHCSDAWGTGSSTVPLMRLFSPLIYDDEAPPEAVDAFQEELSVRCQLLGKPDLAKQWPRNGALLSPDFVYREVRAATPLESEDWTKPVWEELEWSARQRVGPNSTRDPDQPVLFADSTAHGAGAIRHAADRLLAAWYFIERRERLQARIKAGEVIDLELEPIKSLLAIGNSVETLLEYDRRNNYADMRDEIRQTMKQLSGQKRRTP